MSHPLSRTFCQPNAGTRFKLGDDEYELAGKIGDGAIGLVRKVVRIRDKVTLAIKFLAPDPKYIEESSFDDVAARFKREGERGAKLSSPHLVTVHQYQPNSEGTIFGQELKNPFLMMEYVVGKTLESYIRNLPKPLPTKTPTGSGEREMFPVDISLEKIDLAIQILEGLDYLHDEKLVHRDVKPANIFLAKPKVPNGRYLVQLGDFGIVKWGDFHASLTTGILTATDQRGLGTLKYMAPEQAIAPNKVSAKSDVYSVGITLFELITNKILASPHHVTEIMLARLAKGTTISRFFGMGYQLSRADEEIGELLLDTFLRGIDGRPRIAQIRSALRRAYEQLAGNEWSGPHE
jgi:serine/threonine protein kinase